MNEETDRRLIENLAEVGFRTSVTDYEQRLAILALCRLVTSLEDRLTEALNAIRA